jgi:hypothetical protein
MEGKVKIENLKSELDNLADDFDLQGDKRTMFIEQVYDYVVGTEVESWDGVYCYVDGLLTTFTL